MSATRRRSNSMFHKRLAIFWIAVLSCGCGQSGFFVPDRVESARGPQIRLNSEGPVASFDLVDLSESDLAALAKLDHERQADVYQVHVAGDLDDPPAMVGDVSIAGQTFRFTPRYALEPGLRYRATFHRSKLPGGKSATADVTAAFEIPRSAAQSPTVVAHIYPSADKLPENQLKFYLHFSAPMSRGEAYRHIHLLSADGKEVEGAFLELGEELWDRDQRRFTLLCDPGRVKRGLKPREELGPVLEEGKNYSLVIDRDWHDATGAALADTITKSFHVLPPDDAPVDPDQWKIKVPTAGTSDPLVVRFPEPLDHAMLERVLQIKRNDGGGIVGSIEIVDNETGWRFTPHEPWTAGDYQLVADATLEDLAGNSINHAFDVDVFGPVQAKIETSTVAIPFAIDEK